MKKDLYCKTCLNNDVQAKAICVWDAEKQAMVFLDFDHNVDWYCNDCETTSSTIFLTDEQWDDT